MNNTEQNRSEVINKLKVFITLLVPLGFGMGMYVLYKKSKKKLGKDVAVQYSHLIKAWQIKYKGYRKQELIKNFDTKKEAINYAKTKINRKQYIIYVLRKNDNMWAVLQKCKTIKVKNQ